MPEFTPALMNQILGVGTCVLAESGLRATRTNVAAALGIPLSSLSNMLAGRHQATWEGVGQMLEHWRESGLPPLMLVVTAEGVLAQLEENFTQGSAESARDYMQSRNCSLGSQFTDPTPQERPMNYTHITSAPLPVVGVPGGATSSGTHYGDCHIYVDQDHCEDPEAVRQLILSGRRRSPKVWKVEEHTGFDAWRWYHIVFAHVVDQPTMEQLVSHLLSVVKIHWTKKP